MDDQFDFGDDPTEAAPVTIVGELAAQMMDFLNHDEDSVEEIVIAGIVVVARHESGSSSTLTRTTHMNTQHCLQMWHAAAASELQAQIHAAAQRHAKTRALLERHGIDPDEG